jgi:hypothetical protein
LLESCVSFGEAEQIVRVPEHSGSPSQACSGVGCRPTRAWIFSELRKHFAFVYMPRTQPNHPQFPLDWTAPPPDRRLLTRAVFIATRTPLNNDALSAELLDRQSRHE